jgi:hypothetical protein
MVLAGGFVATHAACVVDGIVADRVPMDSAFRVPATMNGTPVRMWVDTGSPNTVVSLAAAKRAELPLNATKVEVTDSTGVRRTAEATHEIALGLGATTFHGGVICLRAPDSFGDGVIGFGVLREGAWLFDAPGQILHMAPAEDAEGIVTEQGWRITERLMLGPDDWCPTVTVRLENQRDVTLLLDTGAESTSLPADVVDALELPSGADLAKARAAEQAAAIRAQLERQGVEVHDLTVAPDDGRSIGVHGVVEQRSVHHLRRLTLGGCVFEDLLVTRRDEPEGLLGRDVLGKCVWLLHGPRRELWLLAKP